MIVSVLNILRDVYPSLILMLFNVMLFVLCCYISFITEVLCIHIQ